LEVVTAKMDKASVGQRAADIERHPEVSLYYSVYEGFGLTFRAEKVQGRVRGL
jgi:hypothetical protein